MSNIFYWKYFITEPKNILNKLKPPPDPTTTTIHITIIIVSLPDALPEDKPLLISIFLKSSLLWHVSQNQSPKPAPRVRLPSRFCLFCVLLSFRALHSLSLCHVGSLSLQLCVCVIRWWLGYIFDSQVFTTVTGIKIDGYVKDNLFIGVFCVCVFEIEKYIWGKRPNYYYFLWLVPYLLK